MNTNRYLKLHNSNIFILYSSSFHKCRGKNKQTYTDIAGILIYISPQICLSICRKGQNILNILEMFSFDVYIFKMKADYKVWVLFPIESNVQDFLCGSYHNYSVLSLQWLWFRLWPGNFHAEGAAICLKKEKKKRNAYNISYTLLQCDTVYILEMVQVYYLMFNFPHQLTVLKGKLVLTGILNN